MQDGTPPSTISTPSHTRILAIGKDPTNQESHGFKREIDYLIYRERDECIIS
jgi:hypothetical protein